MNALLLAGLYGLVMCFPAVANGDSLAAAQQAIYGTAQPDELSGGLHGHPSLSVALTPDLPGHASHAAIKSLPPFQGSQALAMAHRFSLMYLAQIRRLPDLMIQQRSAERLFPFHHFW